MSNDKAAKRQKFEAAYIVIRDEIMAHFTAEGMPVEAIEWFQKNLDYNVPGGKLNRGISVVDTAEVIKNRALTEEEYFQAAVLGWCIELLQAFFLVSDDIMDGSITRRGQPCWYLSSFESQAPSNAANKLRKIGMIAINDSFMLEACIYWLLKKHFKKESYYVELIELFHDTTYQTEMGQLLDLITAPEDEVDLGKFSLKKHSMIVIYKTAYYSFYLPVALAMYLCQVPQSYPDPSTGATIEPYASALSILLPLGEYFQIQDDFLDFSGTPEQIGKIGTDILDNKCSWCVNTALALATPEQRTLLDNNYGQKNSECEAKVKELYETLGLRKVYAEYEEKAVGGILKAVDEIPEVPGDNTLKRQVFRTFIDKIYKRTK